MKKSEKLGIEIGEEAEKARYQIEGIVARFNKKIVVTQMIYAIMMTKMGVTWTRKHLHEKKQLELF